MLFTALSKKPTNRSAAGSSVPASTGGWDQISPLASMPPERAVRLDNFFPKPGYLEVRRGSALQASGLDSIVETLMVWNGPGAAKLFAVAGNRVWNATVQGSPSVEDVIVSNARVQYVNFTNVSNNHYIVCVNGADDALLYDGATWTHPAITGISSSDAINVWMHKRRLWFVLRNSTQVAYLDTEAVAGPATTFELGSLMSAGGYVVAMTTWTINTAQTIDDYAVFVTSGGQVIVYQGTDPDTAETWSLVGVYEIGTPIGTRCVERVGGDVAIICIDGVLPLSQVLNSDRTAADRISLTSLITNAMNTAATTYANNFGWQLKRYPRGTMIILNIPTQEGISAVQFVMNTLTGAWCRFIGMQAVCWEVFRDRAFFGAPDGSVYEYDVGASDGDQPVVATVQTAFNYFGSPGYQKTWSMIQPLIISDGSVQPAIGMNVDFQDNAIIAQPAQVAYTGPLWDDNGVWDSSVWPTENVASSDWTSISGVGQCMSVVCQVITGGPTQPARQAQLLQINGWNVTMERGEFL